MNNYCQIEREEIEERGKRFDIGLDLRSGPEEDYLDRVCCRCGESLESDGECWNCNQVRGERINFEADIRWIRRVVRESKY